MIVRVNVTLYLLGEMTISSCCCCSSEIFIDEQFTISNFLPTVPGGGTMGLQTDFLLFNLILSDNHNMICPPGL